MNVWSEARKLGYKVLFVPHKLVQECIACYHVKYNNKTIQAAKWLNIPEGEIWISEAYKEFAEYILFHELTEIKYRAQGYTVEKAHYMALQKEYQTFKNDSKWKHLKMEINICTYDSLCSTPGIGKILSKRIMKNRPYNTIEELLNVNGIGTKRYKILRNKFWCIGDRR